MNLTLKKISILSLILCTFFLVACNNSEPKVEEPLTIVPNSIYQQPNNPTNEQIKVYNDLSAALSEHKDKAEIADLVAANFVFDFFGLSNKSSQDNVGGLQYIPEDSQASFKEYAVSYYYSNYDIIIKKYGQEELPKLLQYEVTSKKEEQVTYLNEAYDGYTIEITFKYNEGKLDAAALKTKMKIQLILIDEVFYVVAVA